MNTDFMLSICVIILACMVMILNLRINRLIKLINDLESELLDNDLFIIKNIEKANAKMIIIDKKTHGQSHQCRACGIAKRLKQTTNP